MNKVYDISITKLEQQHELSEDAAAVCGFCNQFYTMSGQAFDMFTSVGHGRFYCPFCLRHGFHHKDNHNILLLNFHGIIGYFYHVLYKMNRTLWQSQIIDYIEKHKQTGLWNPAFVYNDEGMTWFVNFTMVGKTPHKIPVEEIKETVQNIVQSFQPAARPLNLNLYLQKYLDAIGVFYTNRSRPPDRRVLSPTLRDCCYSLQDHQLNFEEIKNISLNFFFNSSLTQTSSMIIKDSSEKRKYKIKKENDMKLVVNVKQTKSGWTGSVDLPNFSGRLRRKDGVTNFPNRSALTSVARSLAKKFGAELEYAEPQKKAAKKTPSKKATKTQKTQVVQMTLGTTPLNVTTTTN